jgi:hypothetical protein
MMDYNSKEIEPCDVALYLFSDPIDAEFFVYEFSCEMQVQWLDAIGKPEAYIYACWNVKPLERFEFLRWCKIASLLASLYGIDSFQLSQLMQIYSDVAKLPPDERTEVYRDLDRAKYEFNCLEVAVKNTVTDDQNQDQELLEDAIVETCSNESLSLPDCLRKMVSDGFEECSEWNARRLAVRYFRICEFRGIEPFKRERGRPKGS